MEPVLGREYRGDRENRAFPLHNGGELCVCRLTWVVEHAEDLISHHVRALRTAGLADYRREGKMALYSLTEQGRTLLDLIVAEEIAT